MKATMTRTIAVGMLLGTLSACATTPEPAPEGTTPVAATAPAVPPPPPKEQPPAPGPMRDVKFPPRQTFTLKNGLTVDLVTQPALPIVQMQLVIMSGTAQDPAKKPGVAAMVAEMLSQGSGKYSAEQFAEAIEFLGANLSVWAEEDAVRLSMRALSEHLDEAMDLMADATLRPTFNSKELEKLRRRELGRLKLDEQDASYLASREFNRAIYGEHPYAHVDTTTKVLKSLRNADLRDWQRAHFSPSNAFLVVVGDVTQEKVQAAVEKAFGKWKGPQVTEKPYPEVPAREALEVLVVDRPESVQSVIYIGEPGVRRGAPDFIPLTVGNQVLGGSAASRLFMDLREKRSLTYGAYSRFDEQVDVGAFKASASVRNAVTEEAVSAFLEHLKRIEQEPIPAAELDNAHRFLADSFPLKIETAGRVADLIADLRLYGLPADYWDTYRTQIREVTAAQAHEAMAKHLDASKQLILVVGKAAEIVPGLRQFGPVRVIDMQGEPVTTFDAPSAEPPPAAAPSPAKPEAAQPAAPATPAAPAKPAAPEAAAAPAAPPKPAPPAQPAAPAKPSPAPSAPKK